MFPAWAGMNRVSDTGTVGITRVPRVGGDEPRIVNIKWILTGVFPAWAGMNRMGVNHAYGVRSVPRVGGDEPRS